MPFDSMLIRFCRINSSLIIDVITTALTPENALSLLDSYDIILDCTDNSPTRYLLSDVAVALRKPLVSGAAQKYEGQLCVYNLGEEGPCYRCLFPIPPPKETLGSCEESGILGVVTGIIGTMQALETIKLISGLYGEVILSLVSFAETLMNVKTGALRCLSFLPLDFLRFAPSSCDLDKQPALLAAIPAKSSNLSRIQIMCSSVEPLCLIRLLGALRLDILGIVYSQGYI